MSKAKVQQQVRKQTFVFLWSKKKKTKLNLRIFVVLGLGHCSKKISHIEFLRWQICDKFGEFVLCNEWEKGFTCVGRSFFCFWRKLELFYVFEKLSQRKYGKNGTQFCFPQAQSQPTDENTQNDVSVWWLCPTRSCKLTDCCFFLLFFVILFVFSKTNQNLSQEQEQHALKTKQSLHRTKYHQIQEKKFEHQNTQSTNYKRGTSKWSLIEPQFFKRKYFCCKKAVHAKQNWKKLKYHPMIKEKRTESVFLPVIGWKIVSFCFDTEMSSQVQDHVVSEKQNKAKQNNKAKYQRYNFDQNKTCLNFVMTREINLEGNTKFKHFLFFWVFFGNLIVLIDCNKTQTPGLSWTWRINVVWWMRRGFIVLCWTFLFSRKWAEIIMCVWEHVGHKVQKEITPNYLENLGNVLQQKYLTWVLDWFVRWTELFFCDFCSVVCLCALFLWLYLFLFVCQTCHETGKLVLCHNFVIGFHLTCVGLSFFCQQINDCVKAVQNIKQKWIKQKHKSWLLTNKMKTMNDNDQKITSFWSVLVWWNHHVLKTQRRQNWTVKKEKPAKFQFLQMKRKFVRWQKQTKKQLDYLVCAQVLFWQNCCCLLVFWLVVRQKSMGEFSFSFCFIFWH